MTHCRVGVVCKVTLEMKQLIKPENNIVDTNGVFIKMFISTIFSVINRQHQLTELFKIKLNNLKCVCLLLLLCEKKN